MCFNSEKCVNLVSAFDPNIEEKQVVPIFKGNVSFAANMSALNSSLTEALSDFDVIDFNALGGEKLKNLVPLRQGMDGSGSYFGCHSWFDWSALPVQVKALQGSHWSVAGG